MALCTSTMSPKDQEAKGVLFFCHGFSDNMSFLKRHNLCRFVREGIAVATIEYEGHGRSDGPLGLIPDFDRLVGDVVHYFQEIAEHRFPGKKCFLMGEVSVCPFDGMCPTKVVITPTSILTGDVIFLTTVHGRSSCVFGLQQKTVVVRWRCLRRAHVQNIRRA